MTSVKIDKVVGLLMKERLAKAILDVFGQDLCFSCPLCPLC